MKIRALGKEEKRDGFGECGVELLFKWGGHVGPLEKVTFAQRVEGGKGVYLKDSEEEHSKQREQPGRRPLFESMLPFLCIHIFHPFLFGPEQSSGASEEVAHLATCPAVPGAPWGRDPVTVKFTVTSDPTLTCPNTQTDTDPDPHAQTYTPKLIYRDPHTMPIEKASVIVY